MTQVTFFHGSERADLTARGVESGPRATSKQAKRGRAFCGFYVTPERTYAERYATDTGTVYAVTMAPGARILTLNRAGQVERIDEAQASAWLARGFDAVQGLNILGTRMEVAILNAAAIGQLVPA